MVANGQDSEENRTNFQFISSEIERLHQLCVDNDLDTFRTFHAAKPFLKGHRKHGHFRRHFLISVSLLVLFCGIVIQNNNVTRNVSSFIRNLSIKVIPWIDWTGISRTRCLIPNPLSTNNDLKEPEEDDCLTCSNVTSIRQVDQIDMEEMCNEYLDNDIPIVLTKQDVYRNGRKTIEDIIEMYLEDEIMNLYKCCEFNSSVTKVRKDHRILLNKLRSGKITKFYAQWQNCFTEASKLFRKVYKRPTLLPSTVEILPGNWIFLSSDYVDDQPIKVPINASVIIFIQIAGSLDVIAEPKTLCEHDCSGLGVRLQPQSILIAPTYLYTYKYMPSREGTSITVGLEGSIDLF